MSWHIYISRNPKQAAQTADISAADWLAVVKNDPSLTETPLEDMTGGVPDVDWRGSGGVGENYISRARLIWNSGSIYAAAPDDATICKMWDIAQTFGGQIVDDDGGVYDRNAIIIAADEVEYA